MKIAKKIIAAAIIAAMCVGCETITSVVDNITGVDDVKVRALVIGVENGYAGNAQVLSET